MNKFLLVSAIFFSFSSAINAQALSATITSQTNVNCNGQSNGALTVTANGGTASYTYLWAPGGQTTPTITNLPAGSYTATVDDGVTTFTVGATVTQPSPLVATATSPSLCLGSALSLCGAASGGTPPYTYTWGPASGLSSSTILCPTASPVTTTSYTFTVTDSQGCTAFYVTTVTVNPLPVPFASNTGPYCAGSTIQLNCTSVGISYSWGGPIGFSSSVQNPSIVSCTPSMAGVYTVTATNAMGCVGTSTTNVTVNPLPTPVLSNTGPYCAGQTINLLCSTNGATYAWVGPCGYIGLIQNPVILNSTTCLNSVFTCTVTLGTCSATATTSVTVNANPTVTINSITEPACMTANGSMSFSGSGGASPYSYQGSAPGVGMWGPSGSTSLTGISAGTATVCASDANGCSSCISNVNIPDSCNLVWPGDANDDLTADNNDLLAISLGNGTAQWPRTNAGNNWIGVPAQNGGATILGSSDDKHIDCNGDGTINLNDTVAVIQNFGLTRPASKFGNIIPAGGNPALKIDIVQDTLTAGSSGNILLSLGDAINSANNIYGIAFTINFDANVIDPASFSINGNGSWMGIQNTNMMCIAMNDGASGMMQGVVSRYDHTNVSGNGLIANMGFITKNNYSGTQNVNFTLSNVVLIDNANNQTSVGLVNDSVVALDPILGIKNNAVSTLKLFPNPAKENVTIFSQPNPIAIGSVVEIFDVTGNLVKRISVTTNSTILNLAGMSKGIYFVKSVGVNKISEVQKLVVE
ncbi:MAG: T9SS type A sorting domain-containing protein [Bacteroidia bacterium]|nr:T9SS type A sorting domain-containing protein [Bacteroidia bacterium]